MESIEFDDSLGECTTPQSATTPKQDSSQPTITSSWNYTQHSFVKLGSFPRITQHPHGKIFKSNVKKDKTVSHGNMNFPPLLISKVPNKNHERKGSRRAKIIRKPSSCRGLIIAEQKRRKEHIEELIELSSIIPGLKKMEETSIFQAAIKYLKQLQERVNVLEEETKKKSGQSIGFVEKIWLSADDDNSPCHDSYCYTKEELPEIEARAQEKNVLIKIHCEKEKGCLSKILSLIEKLHLVIVNISALSFGDYFLDITVVAQMSNEFFMTMKDLKKNLLEKLNFINDRTM